VHLGRISEGRRWWWLRVDVEKKLLFMLARLARPYKRDLARGYEMLKNITLFLPLRNYYLTHLWTH
jgi:hypothetical protein